MKIIATKTYDLEYMDSPNKIIILARIKGKFYCWFQDSDREVIESEVVSTGEGIRDFKVAKEKFQFYEMWLDWVLTSGFTEE